jgi:hypothetical protein
MIVYSIRLWPYTPMNHFLNFVLTFFLLILKTAKFHSHDLFHYVHIISALVVILTDFSTHIETFVLVFFTDFWSSLCRFSLLQLQLQFSAVCGSATPISITISLALPCEINKTFNSPNYMGNSSSSFSCFEPFIFLCHHFLNFLIHHFY